MIQRNLFDAVATDKKVGEDLLDIIEKSVHRIGLKEFAYLINKEPSHVRDALSGNGKYFAAQWVATLLNRDGHFVTDYIGYLHDLCGFEPAKSRKELTADEKIQIYERVIADHRLGSIFADALK